MLIFGSGSRGGMEDLSGFSISLVESLYKLLGQVSVKRLKKMMDKWCWTLKMLLLKVEKSWILLFQ